MRILLALLMSFVLLQTQSFALVGGPVFGGSLLAVSGTYSGVLVESLKDLEPQTGFTTSSGSASSTTTLGIFALGVPTKDIAKGTAVIFQNGVIFQGSIIGIADPERQLFAALVHTVHIVSLATSTSTTGSSTSLSFDASADGNINARLFSLAFSGVRISGRAHLAVKRANADVTSSNVEEGEKDLIVDGFKQSTEVITPTGIADFLTSAS